MTIQWDDNLLTGIDQIDKQHKELFKKISDLLDACNKGKGREEVIKTFSFLEDYVITHLSAEEKIMYKYRYPLHVSHVGEHHQFVSVITLLKKQIEKEGATGDFVININRKVVQWLVSHVTKIDKTLAKHIRENPID